MRTYLAATPDGFALMPGSLTRVAPAPDSRVVLMQQGAGSTDTWVLGDGPVAAFSLLDPTGQPVAVSRGGSDLPSRVADDLFWVGRYAQRADGLIRLLRGILVRLTEHSGLADVPELPRLLCALTRVSGSFPGFLGADAEARLAAPESEVRSLLFEAGRVGSLAFDLQALYRTAGSVRDRISSDMWRAVSRLCLTTAPASEAPTLSDILERLNQAVLTLAGIGGLAAESMTRGHGWRFLDMGRRIERVMHTLRFTRATLAESPGDEAPFLEAPLLEALLEIADCAMTYRRRYIGGPHAAPVLDLLLVDEANPRSLHAQLIALRRRIDELPHGDSSPVHRQALSLLTAVQTADVEQLAWVDQAGRRGQLDEFLAGLERAVPQFADAVTHCYLSHLQPARHFASLS